MDNTPNINQLFDLNGKRVWVAGHRGMAGSALLSRLQSERCDIMTVSRIEVDLARQSDTDNWMTSARSQVMLLAAARVGGIHANNVYPADFLYDNLLIESNIVRAAWQVGVEKLLFLGSSCIYPRETPRPMTEGSLLTGPLEPTNEWYAIAKIAGIKLCQAFRRQYGCDFISAMPTNLYGPGDNFHAENSHVPAALLRRMHDAKQSAAPSITIWGTGRPRREFLYVDDMAEACIFLLKHYSGEQHVNVGTGIDISIGEFAELVKRTVGYEGRLTYDPSRLDGTPRKVMDVTALCEMGWKASTSLEDGLKRYYEWFLANIDAIRQ